MKETKTHIYFWGSIYSQWAQTPFKDSENSYLTAEQYMMYHKAMLMGDTEAADKIIEAKDPKEQKALGRKIINWNQKLWDKEKFSIVYKGNYLKFSNPALKGYLLATNGTTLVEASLYDKIWGVGLWANDPKIQSRETWEGENLLGQVLTKLRDSML